jgi:hypothetical protein
MPDEILAMKLESPNERRWPLENALATKQARRNGDCGLEIYWRCAAASRVGKFREMYRDIGQHEREVRFSGAGNGRMIDFAG